MTLIVSQGGEPVTPERQQLIDDARALLKSFPKLFSVTMRLVYSLQQRRYIERWLAQGECSQIVRRLHPPLRPHRSPDRTPPPRVRRQHPIVPHRPQGSPPVPNLNGWLSACRPVTAGRTPPRSEDDAAVLFVRGMPRDLLAKLKAAAALHQNTLGGYIKEMCEEHVQELERKGILPKPK